jgi:hypothetical protein
VCLYAFISEKNEVQGAKISVFAWMFSQYGLPLRPTKIISMKKLLTVIVIAAALTSCSGSGDTAPKTDSAVSAMTDSAKSIVDSTAVKVDSAVKAVADTAKAKVGAVVDSAKKAVK